MRVEAFNPTSIEEVETSCSRRSAPTVIPQYLRGPIPLDEIQIAAKLGGPCVALLVLIYYRRDVTKLKTVTLPNRLLERFGIGRNAKQRGLKNLEDAKLIDVERSTGHTVVIKLRERKRKRSDARSHWR